MGLFLIPPPPRAYNLIIKKDTLTRAYIPGCVCAYTIRTTTSTIIRTPSTKKSHRVSLYILSNSSSGRVGWRALTLSKTFALTLLLNVLTKIPRLPTPIRAANMPMIINIILSILILNVVSRL